MKAAFVRARRARSHRGSFLRSRGAGADAAGNLYVALGFGGSPSGNLVLRSFTPDGGAALGAVLGGVRRHLWV